MTEARKRVRGNGPEEGMGVGGPEVMMDSAFAKALERYKIEEEKSLQRLQTLQARYASLQKNMETASESYKDEIQALRMQLEKLQTQTKTQLGDIQDLKNKQKEIEQASAEANTALKTAQTQYEVLQKQHTGLKTELAALTTEKNGLASSLETLQATFDALKKQKVEVDAQMEELTLKASGLQKEITALETIKTEFTQQISSTVMILSQWPGTDTSTVPDLIEAVLINADNAETWRDAKETEPIASILAETQNELTTLQKLRTLSQNAEYLSTLDTYKARLEAFSTAVAKAAQDFSDNVIKNWSTDELPRTRKEAIQAYLTVSNMTDALREAVDALIDLKSIQMSAAAAGRGTSGSELPAPPKPASASVSVPVQMTEVANVSTMNASDAMVDEAEKKTKSNAEAQKRDTTRAEFGSDSGTKLTRQRVGTKDTQEYVTPKLPAALSFVTPSPSGATLKPQLPPSPTTTPAAAPFGSKSTAAPPSPPSGGGGIGQATVPETVESVSDALVSAGERRVRKSKNRTQK